MKKLLLLLILTLPAFLLRAQDAATNHATFTYLGKTYTADYDDSKHQLTLTPEMTYEIYDQSGQCVKRGTGVKVDFKSVLKPEEQTYRVRFYKKAKTDKKKGKSSSIQAKGEIGTMVIKDSR